VRKEASASFLKKRSKKLLAFTRAFATAAARTRVSLVVSPAVATSPREQKFFASFFQKRSACFLLSSP
jgi:hypothetical protein